jgi:pyrroline-5-carboxylate reductase
MKIAVIGAGNMGMAFASAFVVKQLASPAEILLVEPREESHSDLKTQGFYHTYSKVDAQVADCRLVILAVKPQDFSVLAEQLKPFVSTSQIILSIMAGVKVAKISKALGTEKIVRCMPNTPAKLGLGVTGFVAQHLNPEEEKWVNELLNATGSAIKFEEERFIDTVTAISGSGPAYFYYFLKAMTEAGEKLGMEADLAKELACETMLGAYHLVKTSNSSFDDLIKAVKSKGGTTEAALNTFEQQGVASAIVAGIQNAEKRAKELSDNA